MGEVVTTRGFRRQKAAAVLLLWAALLPGPTRAAPPHRSLVLSRLRVQPTDRPTPVELVDGRTAMLVSVFATWCRPCRQEVPTLNRLHAALAGRGIRVIAVSVGDAAPAQEAAWMRRLGARYPGHHGDPDVSSGRSILGDVSRVPTTLLVAPGGIVVRRWVGVVSEPVLRAAVEPLLTPKKGP